MKWAKTLLIRERFRKVTCLITTMIFNWLDFSGTHFSINNTEEGTWVGIEKSIVEKFVYRNS